MSASQSPERRPYSSTGHHVEEGVGEAADVVDRVAEHPEGEVRSGEKDDNRVGGPGAHDDQTHQSSPDNDDQVVSGVYLPVGSPCHHLPDDEAVDEDVEGE